jgi:hypothetical protein
MNNPVHIPKSLKPFIGLKLNILKLSYADPESRMEKFGSGMKKIRIRDEKNSDPEHYN